MNSLIQQHSVGIRGIAYHFDETVPIDTLPEFVENPALLKKFKLADHSHYALSHVDLVEQSVIAARKTLEKTGLRAADIDAVVIGNSELTAWKGYPEKYGSCVLHALDMNNAQLIGVTLGGCVNYAGALRVARNLIVAEGYRNVLVIESNQVRGDTKRVIASGHTGSAGFILADGAVSFVVTSQEAEFKVLGIEQLVKPTPPGGLDYSGIIAKNTFGFRHVANRALEQAGIVREDLERVIFHNINMNVLFGLVDVIGMSLGKLLTTQVRKTGHVWGADNLIGLHDYCAAKNPPAGARFLMLCQANETFAGVVCEKL